MSGNPDSIGLFSNGQVRPGPPYDSSNPAGAILKKPYTVRALATLKGAVQQMCNGSLFIRLTAVQQRATGLRALSGQPTEGAGRVGVSVGIDVQVPLGRDPGSPHRRAAGYVSVLASLTPRKLRLMAAETALSLSASQSYLIDAVTYAGAQT